MPAGRVGGSRGPGVACRARQLSHGHAGLMEPGWQVALGRPLGDKGSETSVYLIPTQAVGRGGLQTGSPGVGLRMHVPPEPLMVGQCFQCLGSQKGNRGLFKGVASPWLGRCEGLPRHSADITTHPQAPIAGLGWQHRQKHQPPGQAGFLSRQKHVNRAGATVFSSHRTSQRGIDQDVTQEVVFFSFSWKFESTTLSPIIKHFRERK